MGHNTDFLTRAANNMLFVLTDNQRQELITLAKIQVASINQHGYNRFVLMEACRRSLTGDIRIGGTGLSRDAVKNHSKQLYRLDGQISFERAQIMGSILHDLTTTQHTHLNNMVGHGINSWPNVGDQIDRATLTRDETWQS